MTVNFDTSVAARSCKFGLIVARHSKFGLIDATIDNVARIWPKHIPKHFIVQNCIFGAADQRCRIGKTKRHMCNRSVANTVGPICECQHLVGASLVCDRAPLHQSVYNP
jgi:hypothetical protein